MKPLLLSIKNLTPYLLLIFLYFIFVNIEARNNVTNYKPYDRKKKIYNNQTNDIDTTLRISIPVIPYSQ